MPEVKDIIEIADFALKGGLLGKGMIEGKKFVNNRIASLGIPQNVNISPGEITKINDSLNLQPQEKADMLNTLGIEQQHIDASVAGNISVNIPTEKVLDLAEKQYFDKAKNELMPEGVTQPPTGEGKVLRELPIGKQKLAYNKFIEQGNQDTFEGFVKQFGNSQFAETGEPIEVGWTQPKLSQPTGGQPPAEPPITAEGQSPETKVRGLSKGVEEKAIEKKLTEGFGNLPEYQTVNMKEQAAKAQALLTENPEKAMNIAMGRETPPADILPESIFIAVEDKAIKEGDITTIKELATSSAITEQATTMGQRIRTLAERDPESPVSAITEIAKAREEAVTQREGKSAKSLQKVIEQEIRKAINKVFKDKATWDEFMTSLSDTEGTGFYLPKDRATTFIEKVKSGEITVEKLADMTSKERNAYFADFVGENNAQKVNALFESKLLLKNQQTGIINWIKEVSGLKPEVKRDLLSRVQRMTTVLQPHELNAFLSDLAAQRLGFNITMEEAGKIADLAKTVANKKTLITEDMPNGSKERLDYGAALVAFKQYASDLKTKAKQLTLKEFLLNPKEWLTTIGGVTKSVVASMDNSFFGRQGLKTLFTNPDIWMKNFAKSWGDIGKELKGIDAMLPIKADIFSRVNSLNGKYKAIGLDIGLTTEEAYPSQIPEKIPFFKNLYKASESAYNGAALRFRADLADRLIAEAESNGVDVYDRNSNLGILVNSLTGRGKIAMTPEQHKIINTAIFSIKFLKSNLDTLFAPFKYGEDIFAQKVLGKEPTAESFATKKAAEFTAKILGSIATILIISKMLDPESVEEDPRSSKFGKILLGDRRQIQIDVTGGLAGIVTLAMRCVPTTHNGKWGFWVKNNRGKYMRIGTGEYGVGDPSELIADFMKGKAAPITHVLLDIWRGKDYSRKKVTAGSEFKNLITPISAGNAIDVAKTSAGEDPILFAILAGLDFIGFNVNVRQKGR